MAAAAHREPTSKVELTIECNNLRDMDTFSKSDPMVVVYSLELPLRWVEVGRTEVVWDNLNPKFSKSFHVNYYFEREQKYKFEVYDIDDESNKNLSVQDFIGATAPIRLSNVVTAASGCTAPLLTREGRDAGHGSLTVTAEEQKGGNDVVSFNIRAAHLAALNWFGGSDPILIIHRGGADGRWIKVYESAPVKNNLNPRWAAFQLPARKLCNNEMSRPLLFEILDWELSGSHRPIGYYTTTLADLASGETRQVKLRHPTGSTKEVGSLVVDRCEIEVQPSFVDFLHGGMQINLMLAVDFTGSNGVATQSNSLHYLSTSKQNDYQATLERVGSILAPFDSDGQIPAFGFGARFRECATPALPTRPS